MEQSDTEKKGPASRPASVRSDARLNPLLVAVPFLSANPDLGAFAPIAIVLGRFIFCCFQYTSDQHKMAGDGTKYEKPVLHNPATERCLPRSIPLSRVNPDAIPWDRIDNARAIIQNRSSLHF